MCKKSKKKKIKKKRSAKFNITLTGLLGDLLHSCPTSTKVKNIRYLATTWHIAEPSHLQPSNFVDFTVPRDQGTKGDVA